MKNIYCWKCEDFVPMPEGSEYEQYAVKHRECLESIKAYRSEKGVSLEDTPREELRKPAYDLYEKLTGYKPKENTFDHLWHHNTSEYGPKCLGCGKNLRTPKAKLCVECGTKV